MKNIFGISFSDNGMHLVQFRTDAGVSQFIKSSHFPYPFDFRFDSFIKKENFNKLAELVLKEKSSQAFDNLEIDITIPYNFAFVKKVSLPKEIIGDLLRVQIEWELINYLPDDIANYKINLGNEFVFDDYRELIVIAIKRSVIRELNEFALQCEGNLSSLSLNNFAVENYLNRHGLNDHQKNQLIFKVNRYSIETHFMLSGEYYTSFLDNINTLSGHQNKDQKVLEKMVERFKELENLSNQLSAESQRELQVYIYGPSVVDSTFDLLRKNFSIELKRIETDKYPVDVPDGISYVEAIGSVLRNSDDA
ncbi:MAG: hypothetical protein AB7T22_06690 [Calditrichaceae bacterium]